jgi:hypothetical protein
MHRLLVRVDMHIQRGFGHINANKLLCDNFIHFPHPFLAKCGLQTQATVRVFRAVRFYSDS